MKIKSFVAFLTLPVDAVVKAGKFRKKTGVVQRLVLQNHDHKVF
jgi:hypothetical protein